jgi:3-hydroxyisobutyrate dehydrogenase
MTTVGLVGLGSMGLPMARNLLAHGFKVRGFDTRPPATDALVEAGGERASSAAEAGRGADALVLMVVNAAQAEAALFAEGALDALPPEGIVALMATCPPGAVESIAGRVLAAGRRFADAPVSGGVVGAAGGTLTVMAAAPRATFDAARPVFDAVGSKVFHVGERPGQGAMVKAVNQLLCGVHIAVAAEAFSLAARVGVDLHIMPAAGGPGASDVPRRLRAGRRGRRRQPGDPHLPRHGRSRRATAMTMLRGA